MLFPHMMRALTAWALVLLCVASDDAITSIDEPASAAAEDVSCMMQTSIQSSAEDVSCMMQTSIQADSVCMLQASGHAKPSGTAGDGGNEIEEGFEEVPTLAADASREELQTSTVKEIAASLAEVAVAKVIKDEYNIDAKTPSDVVEKFANAAEHEEDFATAGAALGDAAAVDDVAETPTNAVELESKPPLVVMGDMDSSLVELESETPSLSLLEEQSSSVEEPLLVESSSPSSRSQPGDAVDDGLSRARSWGGAAMAYVERWHGGALSAAGEASRGVLVAIVFVFTGAVLAGVWLLMLQFRFQNQEGVLWKHSMKFFDNAFHQMHTEGPNGAHPHKSFRRGGAPWGRAKQLHEPASESTPQLPPPLCRVGAGLSLHAASSALTAATTRQVLLNVKDLAALPKNFQATIQDAQKKPILMAQLKQPAGKRNGGRVLELLSIDGGEPLATVGCSEKHSGGALPAGASELCGPGGVRYGVIEPRADGTHAVRCGDDETLLLIDGVNMTCGGKPVATICFRGENGEPNTENAEDMEISMKPGMDAILALACVLSVVVLGDDQK